MPTTYWALYHLQQAKVSVRSQSLEKGALCAPINRNKEVENRRNHRPKTCSSTPSVESKEARLHGIDDNHTSELRWNIPQVGIVVVERQGSWSPEIRQVDEIFNPGFQLAGVCLSWSRGRAVAGCGRVVSMQFLKLSAIARLVKEPGVRDYGDHLHLTPNRCQLVPMRKVMQRMGKYNRTKRFGRPIPRLCASLVRSFLCSEFIADKDTT